MAEARAPRIQKRAGCGSAVDRPVVCGKEQIAAIHSAIGNKIADRETAHSRQTALVLSYNAAGRTASWADRDIGAALPGKAAIAPAGPKSCRYLPLVS